MLKHIFAIRFISKLAMEDKNGHENFYQQFSKRTLMSQKETKNIS